MLAGCNYIAGYVVWLFVGSSLLDNKYIHILGYVLIELVQLLFILKHLAANKD